MITLGDMFVKIRGDATSLNQAIDASEKRFTAATANFQKLGMNLTKFVTLPILAIGAISVKTAADFEKSMNKVRALTGATGDEFARLEELAREMGATTQYTAGQAADAMSFMAMAGFNSTKIYSALPSVLSLAAASQIDLAQSADIVTNIMSGFGITAEGLPGTVDILTKQFISANTDLSQLGMAFKYVGPVAKSFGVSIEETSAAIGLLSDAGIQGTSAGTALRAILVRLSSESERLGINAFDASGNMRPLGDVINDIKASGLSAIDSMDIFGLKAGPGMAQLLEIGGDALNDMVAKLQNVDGLAERIAKTQMEGLNGELKKLQSVTQEAGISFGNILLPEVVKIVKGFGDFAKRLGELSTSQKETIIGIAKFAAVMGPAILVTLKMVEAGGKINAIFKTMGTAGTGPVGLAIVGIAALAAATLTFANNVKKGQEEFKKLKLVIEGGTTGKLADDIAAVNKELFKQKDILSSSTGMWPEQDKAIQDQIDKLSILRDKLVAQYRAQGQTAQGAKAIADAAALEVAVEKQLAESLDVSTASLLAQADASETAAQEQYARDLEAYNFHLELLDRREAQQKKHEDKMADDSKAAAEKTAASWGAAYTQMMSVSKAVFAEMGASLVEGTFQWKNLGTAAINAIGAIVSAMGDQLAADAAMTLIKAIAATLALSPTAPGLYASAATLSAGAAAAWASGAALSAVTLANGGLATSPTLAMVGDNRHYDEIVAPLSPDVFARFADGLMNALTSRSRPAGVTEASVGAARGSSSAGAAISINVGTLVADDAGLRNLERTLRKYSLQEDLRVGA